MRKINQEEGIFIPLLSVILVLLLIGLFNNLNFLSGVDTSSITGEATIADVTTSAVIANYFAINASINMTTDGIKFDIESLPATNSNATANYDYDNNSITQFYLTVEDDSNVNVDFCIKANAHLTSGGNTISIGNYTYSNSSMTNLTLPAPASGDTELIISEYNKTEIGVGQGNSTYYRFYLDVPASQPAGTYSNTINFKGVQTTNACN